MILPSELIARHRRSEEDRSDHHHGLLKRTLDVTCASLGMMPIPQPEICVLNAWEKFDPDGRLSDPAIREDLRGLLAALTKWARCLQRNC